MTYEGVRVRRGKPAEMTENRSFQEVGRLRRGESKSGRLRTTLFKQLAVASFSVTSKTYMWPINVLRQTQFCLPTCVVILTRQVNNVNPDFVDLSLPWAICGKITGRVQVPRDGGCDVAHSKSILGCL